MVTRNATVRREARVKLLNSIRIENLREMGRKIPKIKRDKRNNMVTIIFLSVIGTPSAHGLSVIRRNQIG